MIRIFFSYAHEDEGLMNTVRQQLIVHERQGRIVKWYDRMIPPGNEWENEIDGRLREAQIILLFMSPDFIESKYCYYVEGELALKLHESNSAIVIPIILRPCAWQDSPFGNLQALPKDAQPISTWKDVDLATLETTKGVMKVVDELIKKLN